MNKIIIFVAGIAIGAIPAYLLTKNKYEKLYSNEVNKLLEENSNDKKKDEVVQEIKEEKIDEKYAKTAAEYMSSLKDEDLEDETDDEQKEDIIYIVPEAFGDTGNETRYYYLYSDDILADEADQIVPMEQAYEELGYDFISYMGEESDHVIHIRNNNSEIDYEVKEVDEPFYDFKEEL